MRRLAKSEDRMLFGVCGGIAEYVRVDPAAVRLLTVLLTAFGVLPGILVYAAAALIMPDARWNSGARGGSGAEGPRCDSECSGGADGGGPGRPHSDAEFDSFFKKEKDGHGFER